jgi:hypothetical protein
VRLPLFSLGVTLFLAGFQAIGAVSLPRKVLTLAILDQSGAVLRRSTPLGVVVGVSQDGEDWELCSAVHLASGRGFTAAHCFQELTEGWRYYVVFNSRRGKRVTVPITSFLYRGDPTSDIAVFPVSRDVAITWATAGTEVERFSPSLPHRKVTIWSFTPVEQIPDLKSRFAGRTAMVLRPNRCLASQHRPSIELRNAQGAQNLPMLRKVDAAGHLFLDRCSYPVVDGNSGSLVTTGEELGRKVGILSLHGVDEHDFWEELGGTSLLQSGTHFFFHGIDDKVRELTPRSGEFSLSAATLLEPLRALRPALFIP